MKNQKTLEWQKEKRARKDNEKWIQKIDWLWGQDKEKWKEMKWPVLINICKSQSSELSNGLKRVWNLLFTAAIAFAQGQEAHVQTQCFWETPEKMSHLL